MSEAAAEQWAEGSSVRDYISLLKPRVMSLVVFTGFAGMWLAPGRMDPWLAAITVFCIALGSGAAGAINMWYDRDIDALMKRTSKRPIPSGKIEASEALFFGGALALFSVLLISLAANPLAAALLALAIGFYVFVYTIWLKRLTPQNIVIGGAAGALPPVIGWAAVTGNVGFAALALFAIIFAWTPPHFWALSLLLSGEYKKAGVPMLPVVSGEAETKRNIFGYSLVLAAVSFTPPFAGLGGAVYIAAAFLLNVMFVGQCFMLLRGSSRTSPIKVFWFSILYLFLLYVALIADKLALS